MAYFTLTGESPLLRLAAISRAAVCGVIISIRRILLIIRVMQLKLIVLLDGANHPRLWKPYPVQPFAWICTAQAARQRLLSHHAQSWVCRRVWPKSHTLVSVLILSRYRLEICTIEAATTGVLVWICSTWPLSISLHCRRDQRLSVGQERAILDEGSDASGGGFHSSPE